MPNSLYGLIFFLATLPIEFSGTKTFFYQTCKAITQFTEDKFLPYALENNWEDIPKKIAQDKTSHTRCYFDLKGPTMILRKVSGQAYFYSSVQRDLDTPRRSCWIKLIDSEKFDRNKMFIFKRTKSILDYLGSLSTGPSSRLNLAIEYWDFFQFDETKVFISYPLYEPVTFQLLRKLSIETNKPLESLKIRLIKNILTGLNFLHTHGVMFRDLK